MAGPCTLMRSIPMILIMPSTPPPRGASRAVKGSKFFCGVHPFFSGQLARIRFLINLDIMGNAQDGVTVVNATEYPREFPPAESPE